jgi:pimeloyl-ACP methyl ester carboxylesterase
MLADEAHRQRSPMRYTREEMEACWTRITAPLLLIHAGDSGYLNRIGGERALQRWRELVPALQVAAVDQAGHMLHHEQPAQTAAHIRRFAADR